MTQRTLGSETLAVATTAASRTELDAPARKLLALFDGIATVDEVAIRAVEGRCAADQNVFHAQLADLMTRGLLVPVEALPPNLLAGARVHCTGTNCKTLNCCNLTVGPLDPEDIARIAALDWAGRGVELPPDWFESRRDGVFMRRIDGSGPCVFTDPDGLCRIHKNFGFDAKPETCRLYPVLPLKIAGQLRIGLDYDCTGLAYGHDEGAAGLDAEVAAFGGLVRRVIRHEPVLPDPDPSGVLIGALDTAAARRGPEAALRVVGARAASLLPPGEVGLQWLLGQLRPGALRFAEGSASTKARLQMGWLAAGLGDLVAAQRLDPWTDEPTVAGYVLGYVRNHVFLGESFAYYGLAAGYAESVLAVVLGARLAAQACAEDGRRLVTLDDAAFGLSSTVGALRIMRVARGLEVAGARLVEEAAALLEAPAR